VSIPSPSSGPASSRPGAPAFADEEAGETAVSLRDVVPLRYRLAEGTPEMLSDLGGQARIKAFDSETGSAVFIKVAEDGASIPKEAEVLTRLDHPAIVRLKRWGRGGGAAFLILDLIDAPDLETVLRRSGKLGIDDIRALLAALCPGVAAIHGAGCLHRDLKPANILVPSFAAPVIADFGAAIPTERAGIGPESWLTDGYAAPEQYEAGGREGPWTDLYGLAATAYRALIGTPPLPAPARLAGAWMTPAVTAVGDAGMELALAIDRALVLDPERRPRSADAWADMLGVHGASSSYAAAASPVAPMPATNPGSAALAGNGIADEVPPTVRIRRSGGQRPAPAAAAVPDQEPPAGVRPRRRLLALALACVALGLLAAGYWAGRPFYETYLKREWLVASDGSGDTASIAEALRRAGDGARVSIGNGTFAETVVVNRPIELVAAEGAAPVIAPPEGPCLVVRGEGAVISGVAFRGAPAADPASSGLPCVLIASGTPKLQDSQVSSPNGPAILVRDGARPLLQRNTVSETPAASVVVRSGAEPTILENTIRGSGSVVFSEGAKGTFQNNIVSGSRASGLQIRTGADPRVVGNTIEAAAEAGIYVYDSGRGYIEDNRVLGSTLSGIVVADGGAPSLIGNAISASGEHGIIILEAGGGAIDRNTITGNKGNGLVLSPESTVELGTNQLEGNAAPQLVDARGGAPKP
jgi:parallel beta-helix repeat protein